MDNIEILSDEKRELKIVLFNTHYQAAFRDNASTQVLKAAWQSNGKRYIPTITAAMQMFGGLHAPIHDTYNWLLLLKDMEPDKISGQLFWTFQENPEFKFPGFGSSFFKGGELDPILTEFRSIINYKWSIVESRIRAELLAKGKFLNANLAFFTAMTMIELGININLCETIMLEARLKAWNKILSEL